MPYGQAFQTLPGADTPKLDYSKLPSFDPTGSGKVTQTPTTPVLTPFDVSRQEYLGRAKVLVKAYQDQFNAVKARSKQLGEERTVELLNQLTNKALLDASSLKQKHQMEQVGLNQIKALQDKGLISNGDEILWGMVAGREAQANMFPEQPRQYTQVQQLKKADEEAKVLEDFTNQYQEVPYSNGWFSREVQAHVKKWDPDANGGKGGYAKVVTDPAELEALKNARALQKLNMTVKQGILAGGSIGRSTASMVLGQTQSAGLTNKLLATQVVNTPPAPKSAKPTRAQLLAEYKRLGGDSTDAGKQFAMSSGLLD